jgi:protein-tyrosine phosphatase
MAEAILVDHLRDAPDAVVRSAGLMRDGMPIADETVEVLEEMGLAPVRTVSALLDDEVLERADLVVTMTRAHVREVVVRRPDVFPRIFTLKELVRRGSAVGGRQPGQPLSDWLEAAGSDRTPTMHLGDSLEDDIEDPVGQPIRVFRTTATELNSLLGQMVDLVWPSGVEV